jgi:zinc transport system substrate-binding protein
MWDLAVKAAAGVAEVRCLVPPGAEPHEWEPSPRDIIGLNDATLFFYSGAGFENWITDVLPELQSGGPVAVAAAEAAGVPVFEGDPHVWLSPRCAKLQFLAMVEAISAAFPQHAEALNANAELWAAEFDRLGEEFKALEALPKKSIVVTHAAFGYLCREYGLTSISPVGYSPVTEADPYAMARVIRAAKEENISVIFYDKPVNMRLAETIAAETGAKALRLNTLESPTEEELKTGDYFSAMRENLAALKEALS